ncbi:pentatricopeptide repeat-containing protein at1g20230 [Phtheirospermum japonicum]|uniref:Pentatricopeptide repeat-containing protein at1g20230 n=1 Tax=Phtheirospermum japonicum TaxID=374723 RepID=A0A830BR92_9LAMI|nr:pentatricopeptide repeat-containing protein at1g20230 [Phtheirospermum japonicum]
MFFVQSLSWSSARPLSINPRNPSLRRLITTACSFPNPNSSANSDSDDTFSGRPNNFSGVQIEETVGRDSGKLRLDSWISSRMSGISRARVQSSIRSGLVSVNGHVISKVSHVVRDGDAVNCKIAELQPLRAEPEDIALDIVYEDEHLLVVNKPAHMVVHPAPGNATGTLVNGILRHCRLSSVSFNPEALPEIDYDSGDEVCALPVDKGHSEESIRPGIVHRLDKGTSGLLVVAKDEHSHAHLAEQFKKHTIKRVYVSLTCGVPSPTSGRVDIPIGRDPNNRIRMIASPGSSTRGKARSAVSRNKLVSLYCNNHHFSDAKNLLRSFLKPDLISFTALINASSKSNDFKSTLGLFSQMLMNGHIPDAHVLPSIIKACAGLLSVKIGKQVHGFSIASGRSLDSFVESSLLHFYVKCDELNGAHKLFDKMAERDVVSWSALAAGYARKGDVANAKKVFCEVKNLGFKPNTVSWNGMIAGFNQSGCFLDAVLMFQQMHLHGFKPDGTSISSVLPAIGDLGYLNAGTQVHGHVIKIGFAVDKCIVSALIDMYGKCGCAAEMSRVFEDTGRGDVGACNAVIAGLARHGLVDEALKVFEELRSQGTELNVVSWTSVIACCSQHGKDIEALNLFREMQAAGVKPNAVTIPCLLPACGNIAALMHGKGAHCFSLRRGISGNVYVGSALIDMYANCGKIQSARSCFDRMPARNLVCWNAMLGAYAMHGKANEAVEIFHSMQRYGQKPDFVSFTSLLSACSQSGLTEEGHHYFESMLNDYGIKARVEHYSCIVSLLGRAGKLEEAYSMIEKMPMEPDACVWGSLLSSCRLHHNMSLGEIAAGKLFELEPRNPGNYVLLSNIYASKGKWKEVNRVRDIMRDKGLRKNPGCSWIEVKNRVYMLLAGDKSLPQMDQILDKLSKLSMEMKKAGYLPNTDYVLQDVEEQEKEQILCGHSEKLAVVFGILNTSQGASLRVTKNLRICGDCHAFIKFISGFEGREIFVRDTNRYHHFKDGDCSCGDYCANSIRRIRFHIKNEDVSNVVQRPLYKVIEILAGGGCALVEWRLETGRTHQIRAHAKYLGIPLMGDEVYGGTKSMAISQLQSRSSSSYHRQVLQLVDRLERPCLHAFTLGKYVIFDFRFKHPHTGENLRFSQMPPTDFAETLEQLRDIGTKKLKNEAYVQIESGFAGSLADGFPKIRRLMIMHDNPILPSPLESDKERGKSSLTWVRGKEPTSKLSLRGPEPLKHVSRFTSLINILDYYQ